MTNKMTVIPKVILIYKLRIYNIGDEGPFDTIYCRPENLHYWVGVDYAGDGHEVFIDKIWVSPSRHHQLFPRHVWENSVRISEEW